MNIFLPIVIFKKDANKVKYDWNGSFVKGYYKKICLLKPRDNLYICWLKRNQAIQPSTLKTSLKEKMTGMAHS